MVSENFDVGDLVWAKMKGYPLWPARIEEPSSKYKAPKHKKSHFVYFFGSENYAWIQDVNISPHSDSILENFDGKKLKKSFQNAIEALVSYSKDGKGEKSTLPKSKKEKNEMQSSEPKKKIVKVLNSPVKKHERKVMVHKSAKKKVYKKRQHEVDTDISGHYLKSQRLETEFPPEASIFPSVASSNLDYNGSEKSFLNQVELECESSSFLKRKHVSPSELKFGFIGLGHIGRNVVKNLINSGHNITVWNRTSYKCDPFVRIGARKALSVAELVTECDIIFCCVSDSEASKSIIFGDTGILKGLELAEKMGMKNKGYVEMTSMDPETSEEIAEAVIMKNGKYLEAPISGTSENAQDGTLLVLAAGDRRLFLDCISCFHAMGKHAYYISCDVGYGTKMGLILSMLSGTVYAALAEAMVLIERLKIPKNVFTDILRTGPLQCAGILNKAEKMELRDFRAITPLKHMQKDLNLSMWMANQFAQPMRVTSTANEVYKHARRLQYSEHDVSAVFLGIRS